MPWYDHWLNLYLLYNLNNSITIKHLKIHNLIMDKKREKSPEKKKKGAGSKPKKEGASKKPNEDSEL